MKGVGRRPRRGRPCRVLCAPARACLQILLPGAVFCLLTACSGKPHAVVPVQEAAPLRQLPIFVVSHGWHTGLIVPGAVLNEAVPDLRPRFGTPEHYEIGWGDVDFYQAETVTSGLAVQAIFWSRGAVLHLVAFSGAPQDHFAGEPIRATCLSPNELRALQAYLAASFSRSAAGSVSAPKPGIYGDSAFYAATGRYSLFNTCNTWTAKALRSAGLESGPGLKLTSASVMHFLERRQRACTQPLQ